jgi:acetyl-CoA carboxylase biotin carboxyl carrier protein
MQAAPSAPLRSLDEREGAPFEADGANSRREAHDADAASSHAAHVVRAPLVGVAWRRSEPDAKALAAEGDYVRKGDALCLIEAMKMFSEIAAPVDGRVARIHFEDGALVEFGAPLVSIDQLKRE